MNNQLLSFPFFFLLIIQFIEIERIHLPDIYSDMIYGKRETDFVEFFVNFNT
jgi:hypothetical protein